MLSNQILLPEIQDLADLPYWLTYCNSCVGRLWVLSGLGSSLMWETLDYYYEK